MLKQRKTQLSILISVSVCVMVLGSLVAAAKLMGVGPFQKAQQPLDAANSAASSVKMLVSLSPQERSAKLVELATLQPASTNPQQEISPQSRARYLLASDLIQQGDATKALELLDNLEQQYPVLASHIAQKRAQAYELSGDKGKAQKAWQELLKNYPNDPVAAEALYVLGKSKPEYWQQAITEFPAHPRSIEIALKKLKENPNQPQLMLLVAKHGHYVKDYGTLLEQLVQQNSASLKPEDWEEIAFGYWEKQDYGKGAIAYGKAPRTAKNLYRKARGLWLDGKIPESKIAYQELIAAFPDSEDTGLGLIRLSRLNEPKDAMVLLDRAIGKFPNYAPEALLDKSKLLDKANSAKSASDTRKLLLTKYSNSDKASELRWAIAQQYAKAGDLKSAWQWARELTTNNPDSEQAPEAAFWVGKWAQQLGRDQDAKTSFEYTILRYPESYFAWRSAVLLGWPVGDFTTVRDLSPKVVRPLQRPEPSAGSPALKELYQLGQDRDAWTLWQIEFIDRIEPSISEQFTDGLMRIGVGDNLDGLWMIGSLRQREKPDDRTEYLALRQQPAYWQALYPFPYLETIVKWSQERQINSLLVTALIRQESRFMPGIKSVVGATGLMQVMPETATWVAEKINLKKYSLENIDDNIKLGTWYLDHTHDEYKNNSMLAVASYNAGPNAVADWLKRFSFSDPDAFAEKIPFPETKGYVKSVFENYWNYLRIYNPEVNQLMSDNYEASQKKAK
ncbi:transglycosylase SLT domain-containing protein [Tychonema sp. LEGE 07199]|uniref:lytic transglycosylase domain-containing protein n=1 Tax=unclassified Tychonema TaxID=2642144 RepID=UPI00187FBE51|nr:MULTISPECIES: transglycosylase SLT domain-containing protein [unclassified Tychonema]MBE9121400.1 transglycosylase SLT domain-containing protein [Tychonema sp. LEGE 07199]MBE9132558.1 transglycosylase SLT domain-containing protein [Tychonema sp. LEGE 07196]